MANDAASIQHETTRTADTRVIAAAAVVARAGFGKATFRALYSDGQSEWRLGTRRDHVRVLERGGNVVTCRVIE